MSASGSAGGAGEGRGTGEGTVGTGSARGRASGEASADADADADGTAGAGDSAGPAGGTGPVGADGTGGVGAAGQGGTAADGPVRMVGDGPAGSGGTEGVAGRSGAAGGPASGARTGRGRRVGRPRAKARPDNGMSPREELLAAAAELFTTRGYTATTTRAIAERAGMRQASMYHYVGGKEDLLAELLEGTVTPSLALARTLLADAARPAGRRLWELCRADVQLLCAGPYNLGALYLLPEVRAERFASFHALRAELRAAYGQLLAATPAGAALPEAGLALRTDLLFALIEGVILAPRRHPAPVFAAATADAALRLAGG